MQHTKIKSELAALNAGPNNDIIMSVVVSLKLIKTHNLKRTGEPGATLGSAKEQYKNRYSRSVTLRKVLGYTRK